jgi:hypothetical protein
MERQHAMTGAEAGLSGDAQIRIALQTIDAHGGIASMSMLYPAVEQQMNGAKLSEQGKASLRYFINRVAVQAGYLYPSDPAVPGWRITPEGRAFLGAEQPMSEEVINVDTSQSVQVPSSSARGTAFELYILQLLKKIYPDYAWYHQGVHKDNERGLDLIGSLIGNATNQPQVIGVQVKFHAENAAPSQLEWFKFLAGCFARQVDQAIFVTSGRLTSEQRREAGEARVIVIEGRDEITRIADSQNIPRFDLFDERQET